MPCEEPFFQTVLWEFLADEMDTIFVPLLRLIQISIDRLAVMEIVGKHGMNIRDIERGERFRQIFSRCALMIFRKQCFQRNTRSTHARNTVFIELIGTGSAFISNISQLSLRCNLHIECSTKRGGHECVTFQLAAGNWPLAAE